MRRMAMLTTALLALTASMPARAQGEAEACPANEGPAIQASIAGLKDRTGEVKLELYPDNAADFLKDDRDLIAQGKVFRRVRVPTPASGPIVLCMKVPRPGRYALLFTHNRDGKNKFSPTIDGAGVPSNRKMGYAKPRVETAVVTVGETPLPVHIRVQYLGLFGFAPASGD